MKKFCSLIVICFMFLFIGDNNFIIAQSDNLEMEQTSVENENIMNILELSVEEIEEKLLVKAETLEIIDLRKYSNWICELKKTKYDKWAKELFATIYKGQDEILEKINSMHLAKRVVLAQMYSKGKWEKVDKIIKKTEEKHNYPVGVYNPFYEVYIVPEFEYTPIKKLYVEGYTTWEECYSDFINEYLYLYFEENPEMLYKVNQLSLKVRNYIVVSLNN